MGRIVNETFWKLFAQSRERKNRFTEKILKTEKTYMFQLMQTESASKEAESSSLRLNDNKQQRIDKDNQRKKLKEEGNVQ